MGDVPRRRNLRRLPLVERFWARVDRSTDGCWLWTGAGRDRYGAFNANGRMVGAHRFSYELAYGPIPAGLYVCHHCDVTQCVRPEHLFLGTSRENMLDASRKGRVRNGKDEQTHCPNGHERIPANRRFIRSGGGGYYECKICRRERHRRYVARHAERATDA